MVVVVEDKEEEKEEKEDFIQNRTRARRDSLRGWNITLSRYARLQPGGGKVIYTSAGNGRGEHNPLSREKGRAPLREKG